MPRLSVEDCEVVMEVLDEKIRSMVATKQVGVSKYLNVRKRLKQRWETYLKSKEQV